MNDLIPIVNILNDADKLSILNLVDELKDTWHKRQVFRTETEMRVSVLNDGAFPTVASKYWQCVREQAVMLDNLISLSFQFRRNALRQRQLSQKLLNTTDEFKIEKISIDLEETKWQQMSMEQVAQDRVREILKWSQLKHELDDNSFDTTNVNTHQAEGLLLQLKARLDTLTEGSSQAEVLNVVGPLKTVERLQSEGILSSRSSKNILNA